MTCSLMQSCWDFHCVSLVACGLVFVGSERLRHRSVCTSVQSGLCLCVPLAAKFSIQVCLIANF